MSRLSGTREAYMHSNLNGKIFRELKKNCELNGVTNVICQRIAIGDRPQIIEMDDSEYSDNEGGKSIGHGGDLAEMRTIDSFNLQNISFIKIDVERTEDAVLDGMLLTIQNNRPPIAIEIQGGHVWETAPSEIRQKIEHSINKLQALGYKVERLVGYDYLALPIGD